MEEQETEKKKKAQSPRYFVWTVSLNNLTSKPQLSSLLPRVQEPSTLCTCFKFIKKSYINQEINNTEPKASYKI